MLNVQKALDKTNKHLLMQMGGNWFYIVCSTKIMWDLFPYERVKTTQIQPTVKNVQLILLKDTQWNQLTEKNVWKIWLHYA